jgi:hypothetical protein
VNAVTAVEHAVEQNVVREESVDPAATISLIGADEPRMFAAVPHADESAGRAAVAAAVHAADREGLRV